MIHHILLTFTTTKPLPADFVDVAAGRIYNLDIVEKKECTATLIHPSQVDLINGVDMTDIPAILKDQAC